MIEKREPLKYFSPVNRLITDLHLFPIAKQNLETENPSAPLERNNNCAIAVVILALYSDMDVVATLYVC